MHDIKFIREHPQEFDNEMKRRNLPAISAEILALDEENRRYLSKIQELNTKRNSLAKEIGSYKNKGDDEFKKMLGEAELLKKEISEAEQNNLLEKQLQAKLEVLPNILAKEVPAGTDDDANIEVKKFKEPSFPIPNPLQHFEIGEKLGLMDFEQTAKISGSRFVTLKGPLAQLERALANFMLDTNFKAGFTEILPPFLVREKAMYGVGQLPKFAEDSFVTTEGYRLIPTAEVSLCNLVADKILSEEELPLRFTAYSPCFRSEAGSAGKDTRGIFRNHQFSKVELVSIVKPEESREELDKIVSTAESILQALEIPYRVVLKCAGDTSFSGTISYDIEVWLPGQKMYREISSCTDCGPFQARRMGTRLKTGSGNIFPHTLNGSSLAIGRTIVAILENFQQQDGSIIIPQALRSYMRGAENIAPLKY